MKHSLHILSLAVMLLSSLMTYGQTPFDAFSPETSRPILDRDSIAAWRAEQKADTILCAIVADLCHEQLLLVDLTNESVLAYAPFTEEMKNWMSVDPLADKNISTSPYLYCSGNPIILIDPDGKDDEWSWNGEIATRVHVDNESDNVRVNGRLLTDYDYNNADNQLFLSQIGKFYMEEASIKSNCTFYMVSNEDLGADAFAYTNMKTKECGFVINNGAINSQAYTISNIVNTFVHEGVHMQGVSDELQAISVQMNHASWNKTTSAFKISTAKYACDKAQNLGPYDPQDVIKMLNGSVYFVGYNGPEAVFMPILDDVVCIGNPLKK